MHSCGWLLYVLLFACCNSPLLVRSALVVCRHGCLIQTVTLSSRLFVALLVPPNNCPPALVTTTATFFFVYLVFWFWSFHFMYMHAHCLLLTTKVYIVVVVTCSSFFFLCIVCCAQLLHMTSL